MVVLKATYGCEKAGVCVALFFFQKYKTLSICSVPTLYKRWLKVQEVEGVGSRPLVSALIRPVSGLTFNNST
jgi:hypothetical protein